MHAFTNTALHTGQVAALLVVEGGAEGRVQKRGAEKARGADLSDQLTRHTTASNGGNFVQIHLSPGACGGRLSATGDRTARLEIHGASMQIPGLVPRVGLETL